MFDVKVKVVMDDATTAYVGSIKCVSSLSCINDNPPLIDLRVVL